MAHLLFLLVYHVSKNVLQLEVEGPQLKCKRYVTSLLLKQQQKIQNILA